MSRAVASGRTFEHASVPEAQQAALQTATNLYAAVRRGESDNARLAETERLSARQSQGATFKP